MTDVSDFMGSPLSAPTHLFTTLGGGGGAGGQAGGTVQSLAALQAANQYNLAYRLAQSQASNLQHQALISSQQGQASGPLVSSSQLAGRIISHSIVAVSTEPKLSPYSMLMWRTQRPLWRFILATGLWRFYRKWRS